MTTSTSGMAAQRRRVRQRPAEAAPAAWTCENCTRENTGRRRRCRDCGTTRD